MFVSLFSAVLGLFNYLISFYLFSGGLVDYLSEFNFSIFFSSSGLLITLFIPIFGWANFDTAILGFIGDSFSVGFKDSLIAGFKGYFDGFFKVYLTTASVSPYFFSSKILFPFFFSEVGTTFAVYGLKTFFVYSTFRAVDEGPVESLALSFGSNFIFLSVIPNFFRLIATFFSKLIAFVTVTVGISPSFNILVAYKI